MIKKWLLTFLLCGCFFNLKGLERSEMKQLLDQIGFALFVLEDNVIRMESYRLSELTQELSKELSSSHCLFTLDMTELSDGPRSLAWDQDTTGCVNIVAGQESAPMIYHFLLDKLVPAVVQSETSTPVYCDCTVTHSNNPGQKTKNSSKSCVSVSLSSGGDSYTMELVFDGKMDAACGFLVQHDLLENEIALRGKVGMQTALDKGILVMMHKADAESQDHKKDTQEVDEFDRLVDEAGDSFMDNVELRKPSNFELMIRRILGPLVQVYTSTVLEFRKFKSWFLQQWHNREILYLWAIGGNRNDQEHEEQQ